MKHAKKILYHFYTMKATILDTPGVNFIDIFCARFLYESYVLAVFSSQKSTFVQKNVRKMLMKLTHGRIEST
jgi:hypothetical protein